MKRPSKNEYYLGIAEAVSKRSTCIRRQYGAVIVNADEIISTGYNGAPRGEENCADRGCCERNRLNIPKGERYELCRSVHAEQNAIISAARKEMIGAVIYITGTSGDGSWADGRPCEICSKMIKNAGIKEVVFRDIDGSIKTMEV